MVGPADYKTVCHVGPIIADKKLGPSSSAPLADHWICTIMAAIVPWCTGKWRLVRVINVLISLATGAPAQQIMLLSFRFSGVLS